MKFKHVLVSLVVFALTSSVCFANMVDKSDKDYFTVSSMEVKEITGEVIDDEKSVGASLGAVIAVVDQLMALGKKVWPVVEKGRPVSQTNFAPLSVLPKVDSTRPVDIFNQMYNWSSPKSRTYKVTFRNLYRIAVVEFEYSVSYQYGGTRDGKGRYLTGVYINPKNVMVRWGFDFNASSKLINVSNVGSDRSSPVAAATIKLEYEVKNVLNSSRSSETFFITGDGRFRNF